MSDGPRLTLTDVTKRYGPRTALDGLTLEVAAGQVLALLGPNGAGKTTLVQLASGLLAPDRGTVRVAGRDPRSRRDGDRRDVGVAPQDVAVYPVLTVAENLRCFAEVAGLSRRDARRRVDQLAEPLALTELLDRRAGQLSGGEQRRLHTAIALVHQPSLVLLDEPTAGADVTTRARILDVVRDLARDGTAVLYTTHYLPEVEQLGADVAVLERGRIVATGTVQELVAAHAEAAVVLEVDERARDGALAALPEARADGARLRVACTAPEATLPALLARLGPHAAGLRAVELVRPSLEAAYLQLTGRGVSAPAADPAPVDALR